MREREIRMQIEGNAFFSEADIDDAAELLIEQERAERMAAGVFEPMTQISEGDETMMLDEMVQQEERELDEMLTAYAEPETTQQKQPGNEPMFDDEDYDALFMELASQQETPDEYGMDLS